MSKRPEGEHVAWSVIIMYRLVVGWSSNIVLDAGSYSCQHGWGHPPLGPLLERHIWGRRITITCSYNYYIVIPAYPGPE